MILLAAPKQSSQLYATSIAISVTELHVSPETHIALTHITFPMTVPPFESEAFSECGTDVHCTEAVLKTFHTFYHTPVYMHVYFEKSLQND